MAAPEVALIARPTGLSLPAPQSNGALELASSLAGVNEALQPALQGVAKTLQARASAKAEADAMANSGKAFGDAVREGKLRPTQNPWYIQAYVEKSAAIRAQAEGAQLVSDSQTWAERSDPQAFAQRWAQEVGKLAQNFTNPVAARGFAASMDPISSQVLNTNLEYNAQRITQENVQNTTQLMSSAIAGVYKANPKADPKAYYDAIQPYLDQWHGTGGTDAQANALIKGAFSAAAANVGDGDLLDALKYDRGNGKGSVYDIVDAKGNPYAADIEQTRYYVFKQAEIAGMGAVRKAQAQQEIEGFQVQNWAYQKYGWDLMSGKVPMQEIRDEARAAGFSPQGVQAFFREESRDLSSIDAYMSAQTRQYAKDPANQETILKLRTEALRQGFTPSFEARVWEQVRNGMDEQTANDILTKADSTAKYFHSEAKAGERERRSQANFDRSQRQQAARDFKQTRDELIGNLSVTLQGVGDRYLLNPTFRTQVTRGATDAGNAWLRSHPDDYPGANAAMDAYLDGIAKQRLARLRRSSTKGINGGGLSQGNPRVGR